MVQEIHDEPSPSPKQTRELKRRLAEIDDPARYVVLSSLLPKWTLVYDVQRNVYGHNHVPDGAIIRDRKLAECIAKHLADGKRPSDLHVLSVRETKRGYRALEDIPGRKGEKPWRPKFHVSNDIPVFVPIVTPDTRKGIADAMLFVAEHREQLLARLDDCNDREAARKLLVDKCKVTPRQADAVLSMPLVSMTRTAIAHFEDEQEGKRRRKRKLVQK